MTIVKVWESMWDFLHSLDEHGGKHPHNFNQSDKHWDLGVSFEQARLLAEQGDESIVGRASNLLERIKISHTILPAYKWDRHVIGTRLDVSAYLAGAPNCMRHRVRRPRDVRHVRIFCNICGAYHIGAEDMLKRGMAVLGLVEALQASQVHVELYVTVDGDIVGGKNNRKLGCLAIKLDDPLNLSTQSFALAHPAFLRQIMLDMIAYEFKADRKGALMTPHYSVEDIRKAYNLDPSDVYLPYVLYGDDSLKAPEKWIEQNMHQLIGDNT